MDWSVIAALVAAGAAVVGALAAVGTAGIIYWQTRYTLKNQTLVQMIATWQTPPLFPRARQIAADVLIASAKNGTSINSPHLDEVLDFFDTVAMYVKRGMLDFELVYHTFFWAMSSYWLLSEGYIRDQQKREGDELWREYSDFLMPSLIKRGGEKVTRDQAIEYFKGDKELAESHHF